MIKCEQKELYDSLSDVDKFKHTFEWEGVLYNGYCEAIDNPTVDTLTRIKGYEIDHLMHNGTFCTFVSCNCAEPCEYRKEN